MGEERTVCLERINKNHEADNAWRQHQPSDTRTKHAKQLDTLSQPCDE